MVLEDMSWLTVKPFLWRQQTQQPLHKPLPYIDESHPFFLHQGETAGAILVSQPLLGGENYPT